MRYYFFFAGLCLSFLGFAQTLVPSNTLVTETFNSMGAGTGAALPLHWKMSGAGLGASAGWTTASNAGVVTQGASSGTPTAGGRYNWGTTGGSDRAVGVMSDAGYASPSAILAWYRNTTGSTLATITVSFQVERYRVNTDAVTVSFFSSQDGSTWTPRSGGDLSSAVFGTGASSYTFLSPQTVLKTVTITGLSIPHNGDFYLRWVISTGAASQGVGLDEVSLLAGTGTPSLSATLQDQLFNDVNGNNQANEGDGIRYKAVIKNSGTDTAKGVTYNNPTPLNTTLDPGSVKTSALANDDRFAIPANTVFSAGNVLTNDFGLPSLRVVSFGSTANGAAAAAGSTATSDNGGTVSLNANGTFTYTPPAGFSGYDRFSYIATTLPGGSLPNNDAVVTIAVGSAATAVADTYTAIGNVSINPTAATGVLANDGGSSRTVVAVNGDATKVGVATTTTQGGSLTLNADGSFSYNPAAGYEGGDGFSYTVDNGFSAPSTVTVSLTVSGMIWFITNGGGAGDGRLSTPFNSLAAFQALNNGAGNNPASGDHIFIYENAAAYPSSSVALLPNQKLIGQDATASLQTITGYTVPAYSAALPTNNLGAPTVNLSNAGTILTLSTGGGNLVQGLTLSPTSGSALSLTGVASGNHTLSNLLITASGTAGGVNLATTSYSGTLTYASGSITNTGTGTAFSVSGSTATITSSAAITQSGTGTMVAITNHASGGITFQTGTLNASAGNGLQFSNADGSYNFNGTTTLNGGDAGIDILGGSDGSFAFGASTTITSPAGTAFNVAASSPSVTYSGMITQNAAFRVVNIDGTTSGGITFQTGSVTGGAGSNGVNLNAVNGNVSFSNGLTLGTNGARMTSQALTITGGTGTYSLGALSVYTTGVAGLVATNADGTINASSGTLDASGAGAINISGPVGITTLSMTLTTVNATGGTNNVSLTNTGGAINLGNGALSGASATAFQVSAGSAAISYGGSITKATAGRLIDIQSRTANTVTLSGALSSTGSSTGINVASNTGGVIEFSNASKVLSTGTSQAVTLTANTGTTVNFSGGGLALTTTSGNGFTATGGGTLNITGNNNTITSTTGTALNITNTTIGTAGITLRSLSSNGAANGIVLNNSGTGPLEITGDGTNWFSGGTIQNSVGADGAIAGNGIYLSTASNVSLNFLQLNGHQNHAIRGTGVSQFTLNKTRITGLNGNNVGADEGSISFDNLAGAGSIANCYIEGGAEDNVRVVNTAGTLNRMVLNTDTLGFNGTSGNAGILIAGYLTATINATVQNSRFLGSRANHISYVMNESAAGDVIISNNTLVNTHPNKLGSDFGIYVAHASSGTVTYSVTTNSVNNAGGAAIEVDRGAGSTGAMSGSITNNTVGTAGVSNSGSFAGSGIFVGLVSNGSTATHTTTISGNTIRQFTNYGIELLNSGYGGSYLNATISGNNIAQPSPNAINLFGVPGGIRVVNGVSSGPPAHDGKSCINIFSNTITQTGTSSSYDVRVWGRFSSLTALPGLGLSGASTDPNVFINSRNTITVAPGGVGAVNATSTNAFRNSCPPL